MTMKLVYRDYISEISLTCTPEMLTAFPVNNVRLPGLSKSARTSVTTLNTIKGDFGATVPVDCLFVRGHNLTASGSFRLYLYDGPNQTGATVHDSTALPPLSHTDAQTHWVTDTDFRQSYLEYFLTTTVNARSFALEVQESGHTDGYLSLERVLIGPAFVPTYNADYGVSVSPVDPTDLVRTGCGILRGQNRVSYRQVTLDLSLLSETERNTLFRIMKVVGSRSDMYFSLYPGAGGEKERDHSLLCRMGRVAPFVTPFFQSYSTKLVLEET